MRVELGCLAYKTPHCLEFPGREGWERWWVVKLLSREAWWPEAADSGSHNRSWSSDAGDVEDGCSAW